METRNVGFSHTLLPGVLPEMSQLSNEKRAPGCLEYIGDEILRSYVRDYNSP